MCWTSAHLALAMEAWKSHQKKCRLVRVQERLEIKWILTEPGWKLSETGSRNQCAEEAPDGRVRSTGGWQGPICCTRCPSGGRVVQILPLEFFLSVSLCHIDFVFGL